MQLMDPTVDAPDVRRSRAPLLTSLDNLKIGLFTNGKVNADLLIEETAALFVQHHGCTATKMHSKTNASAPAPAGMLEQLVEDCDFLITASGD